MIQSNEDTITAVATPIGEGGISVIRVSGPRAVEIADAGFAGNKALRDALTHSAHFGFFRDHLGEVIDEVVATVFRQPNSYTAEDIVEISCHGGVYITNAILKELINYGARMAMPGEFTKRAFLNGRIDLSQAEAVADLIHARSERLHRVSLQHLRGDISKEITNLRQKILSICSLLELELDFSEERLELVSERQLLAEIDSISDIIHRMLATFDLGRVYREGLKVVLVGRPNVGKSSILNRLLNYERAIVTEVPGTTRDTIEETVNVDGILFRLVDTAGLRATKDIVEVEGISRTEAEIREADIVLLVIEATVGIQEEDQSTLSRCGSNAERNKVLILANKVDLVETETKVILPVSFNNVAVIPVSARSGAGIKDVILSLTNIACGDKKYSSESSIIITSERHMIALANALKNVQNARSAREEQRSNEVVAAELRFALDDLGEIIGAITTEDILNEVFSRFCIGK